MKKRICLLLCALALFVVFAGGCETAQKNTAKNTWQSILSADDWMRRNLW